MQHTFLHLAHFFLCFELLLLTQWYTAFPIGLVELRLFSPGVSVPGHCHHQG